MKGPKGQTLTEYVLAGGLVALVAIAGLGMISSVFQSSLPDLLDRIFGDGPAVATAIGGGTPSTPESPPGVDTKLPVEIVLNDGTLLELNVDPAQLPNLVETNGANGTTRILASRLQQLAQKLQDSGELDKGQVSHLVNLANSAHHMAKIEALVEKAAEDPSFDFMNDSITFEGQSFTPFFWAERVGTNPDIDVFADEHHWTANANKAVELHNLMEHYKMAKDSGTLNDPEVDALVTSLVGQIGDTAKAFHEASLTKHLGLEGDQTLRDLTASTLTHGHGSTICWTGNAQDTGSRCTKPAGN